MTVRAVVESRDGIIVSGLFGIGASSPVEGESVKIARQGVYLLAEDPTVIFAVDAQNASAPPLF